MTRAARWWRSCWCILVNGQHEMYTAHSDARVFQQCLLCGCQSPGWDVTPALRFRSTWMRITK